MKIISHVLNSKKIAEIISKEIVIANAEEGLDLLGNLYYQGYDAILIYYNNLTPEFFDLKNGMAGEILQKFSTYRVRLAIIGDFSNLYSQSLKDFVYESNKGGHINFLESLESGLEQLARG